MNISTVRKLTISVGLLAGITVLVSAPLYFIYDGPPPVWNVLTRDLITLVTCGALLVFVMGFSHQAWHTNAPAEFPAMLAAAAGIVFIAIVLMTISLEAGVVFGTPDGSVDPTIDGPLAHASMLAHGPIKRMLTVIYLVAAGFAARDGLLPGWLRKTGYVIAVVNMVFIPSLYFGTDPMAFYSVHGWANSAVTGSLFFYWVLAVSVVMMLPVAHKTRDTTTPAEQLGRKIK